MCLCRREFHGFSAQGNRRAGAAEGPGTEAEEGNLDCGKQTDLDQLAEQKDEGASLKPGSLTRTLREPKIRAQASIGKPSQGLLT